MSPMFGEEFGTVLFRTTCPRCGAIRTPVRGLKRENTNIITNRLACVKCHLVKFIGFTTTQAVTDELIKTRLLMIRDTLTDENQIRKIDEKLRRLQERKLLYELGL